MTYKFFSALLISVTMSILLSGCTSSNNIEKLSDQSKAIPTEQPKAVPINQTKTMPTDQSNEIHINKSDVMSIDESNMVYKVSKKIHSSLPEFIFRVYGFKKTPLNNAYKITISKKDGDIERVFQELNFDETMTPDDVEFGFVIEDMNFDGYSDIRIQQFLPAAPNIPYYYWLWDVKSSQYIRNIDLEMVTSPEFDPEKQIITSFGRATAVEHYWNIFKYIKGVPTLIKETIETIDPDNKIVHYRVGELVNNEMKVTEYDEPWKQ